MARSTAPVLTRRQLNRALLARQDLLERGDRTVPAAVEHLVGLQAQEPLDPYTGLWSRLAGFAPDDLGRLVADHTVVRIVTWRGTVHLHTAADALVARAAVQGWVDSRVRGTNAHGRAVAGLDLDGLLAEARAWFAVEPRDGTDLRAWLAARIDDDRDLTPVAGVVKYGLPLVQVPPRGVWGRTKRATWSPLDVVLDRPLPEATPDDGDALLRRYLAAFGPATAADVATWSGWTGAKARLDRIRAELVTFRHEDTGRELVDLPDAPRPDPDVPAPPRFLPEFDNVVLSHADRSRIAGEGHNPIALLEVAPRPRMLLVDGMVAGLWAIERTDDRARLVLTPLRRWTRAEARAVEAEGAALLAFHAPGADHDVEVTTPPDRRRA